MEKCHKKYMSNLRTRRCHYDDDDDDEDDDDDDDDDDMEEEEEECSDDEEEEESSDDEIDESRSELDESGTQVEGVKSESKNSTPPQAKKTKKSKLEKDQEKARKKTESTVNKEAIVQHRKEQAEEISCTRILTDEDFERIENAQAKKMKTGFKALQLGKKRKHNVALEQEESKGELVDLGDIENIYKKKKHDKATRLESVLKGREGREKWGYKKNRTNPHASTTNQEKKKDKNFMMVRHKVRGKIKRSFKDKQIELRNHLVK
uniref:Protein SDA1 n=1 Tax=Cacopsylla melanoneura TaxID=428564 RepID=A0A8D8TMC4_9HEMI